jgi:hypothetical protein
MTAMDMKRLGMWESKILSMIYGPVVEKGMWRRNDQEWRELCKDLDIEAGIEREIGMDWTFGKNGSGKDSEESV